MENILKKIGKISSFASRYIGIIIIAFSCLAFFWRDGFAWMTNYTSVFLGVIMFGMGLTIRLEDFRAIFSRPKEVIIGAVAQYTIMPVVAWVLCKVMNLPAGLFIGIFCFVMLSVFYSFVKKQNSCFMEKVWPVFFIVGIEIGRAHV